jgi:hypothetical protein
VGEVRLGQQDFANLNVRHAQVGLHLLQSLHFATRHFTFMPVRWFVIRLVNVDSLQNELKAFATDYADYSDYKKSV